MNVSCLDRLRLVCFGVCLLMVLLLEQQACGAPLQSLLGGDFLDAAGMRFDQWELVSLDATAATQPDLAQIAVLPLEDDPAHPGLQFVANGQLAVSGLNSIDLLVKYRATPLSTTRLIDGHTLELTGLDLGANGGLANISDEIATGSGGDLGSALVFANNQANAFQPLDAVSFAQQSVIGLQMEVFVTGLSDADSVSLNTFTQRFSSVPEPSAGLLALLALPLVVFRRRPR